MANDFQGASWRLEGLKELEQQLVALGDTFGYKGVARRVLKKAMWSAMLKVETDMRSAAPVQPSPRKSLLPLPLKDSVNTAFRVANGRDLRSSQVKPNMVLYIVGIKSSKKLKAQEFGRENVDGTLYPGQPFIRRSFERNIASIRTRFADELRGAMLLFQRTEKNKALRSLRRG